MFVIVITSIILQTIDLTIYSFQNVARRSFVAQHDKLIKLAFILKLKLHQN